MTHDPGSAEINQTAMECELRKTDCWESNSNLCASCFPICKMGVVTIVSGNSLAVWQWLELFAFTAEGPSSIPGHRTKILQSGTVQPEKEKNTFLRDSCEGLNELGWGVPGVLS